MNQELAVPSQRRIQYITSSIYRMLAVVSRMELELSGGVEARSRTGPRYNLVVEIKRTIIVCRMKTTSRVGSLRKNER